MDPRKINDILCGTIVHETQDVLANDEGARYSDWVFAPTKLVLSRPPKPIERRVQIGRMTADELRLALRRCGGIVDEAEDRSWIAVVIMSGFANMNPAVVVVYLGEDSVLMKGYAKEGLIKQHTADRAMNLVEEALKC